MNKEIWRDITGYEGYYQVSSEGRVKSLKRKWRKNEYILKPVVTNCGYYQVGLRAGGKQKNAKSSPTSLRSIPRKPR